MDKQAQSSKKKHKTRQKSRPQTMKNVLLAPYKRSWPILPQQYRQEFENIFYSNLSLLVPQNQPKIPWAVLKDIPKEQRKDIRQKYKTPIEINSTLRKSLIFGINECTKALEKHEIIAIFISSNCNPEMMVNHVVRMAERRKIAVLVILSLKESLKSLIGFPCVCLGIRKSENLGYFKPIVEFVYKIKDMKIEDVEDSLIDNIGRENITKTNIELSNYDSTSQAGQDSAKILNITIADSDESVQIINASKLDFKEHSATIRKEMHENADQALNSDIIVTLSDAEPDSNLSDSVQIIEDSSIKTPEIIENSEITLLHKNSEPELVIVTKEKVVSNSEIELGPYLYRTSTNKRAFVPPRSDGLKKNIQIFKPTEEFISFSGNYEPYVPSVIKRLKGSNRGKNKNKRDKLKNNKKNDKKIKKKTLT